MKESNRHILIEALKQLPEYHPSEEQWTKILSILQHGSRGDSLQENLSLLKDYGPPPWLWDKIENHLNDQETREEKVLRKAISHLPQHEGPPQLWENISEELSKDKKEAKALSSALGRLPQYTPSENIWNSIERELESQQTHESLQLELKKLTEYQAPDKVWNAIDENLNQPKEQESKIFQMTLIRRVASAAAVILFLLIAGIWMNREAIEQNDFVYSQEVLPTHVSYSDSDRDEEAFNMVVEFCKVQALVCEEPVFKSLKTELEELNAAREELKEALGVYGSDLHLMTQLTKVERERSDILKQMVSRI